MSNRQMADTIIILLLAVVLIVIAGPCILLPYPLQLWATAQFWDASDRWDTIKAFAVFGLVLLIPLTIFWQPFAYSWQHLAWLGPASLTNWWLRSFLMMFLFPSATLLLERAHPRTPTHPRRVKLLEEQTTSSAPENAPTIMTKPPHITRKKATSRNAPQTSSRSLRRLPQKTITMIPSRRSYDQPLPERSNGEEMQSRKPQPQKTARLPQADLLPQVSPKLPADWNEGEGTYRENP